MVFIYASQAKPSGRPVGPFTGEDRPSKDAHRPGFESAVCAQHSGMSEPNFFCYFFVCHDEDDDDDDDDDETAAP